MGKKRRRKFSDRIPLQKEVEVLEQYGRPFLELPPSLLTKYAFSIGKFLLAFSRLETCIDHMIIMSINDDSDEPGYRIVKLLKLKDKIQFAKSEYQRWIYWSRDKRRKASLEKRLGVIITKLTEINAFRNKLVHASWESLSPTGFVRVKIEEGEDGVRFERIKLSPAIMNKFVRQIEALMSEIDDFVEEAHQAF
jgi:hypothetical protein